MKQQEYTGPEFEVEFARADYEWKKGGKVGVDPRRNWQVACGHNLTNWDQPKSANVPTFIESSVYRWKPQPKRSVKIGYYDTNGQQHFQWLVAPEVEAPPLSSKFFVLAYPHDNYWEGTRVDFENLNNGCVFLTLEDRDAMTDWLATCRKGGQS